MITNEDNMELMARYPDKYFDLAIVDPPYGINRSGLKENILNIKDGIMKLLKKNTLMNYLESVKIKSFGGLIISLNIYQVRWVGFFGIKDKIYQ